MHQLSGMGVLLNFYECNDTNSDLYINVNLHGNYTDNVQYSGCHALGIDYETFKNGLSDKCSEQRKFFYRYFNQ